jgi:hypothetical protein
MGTLANNPLEATSPQTQLLALRFVSHLAVLTTRRVTKMRSQRRKAALVVLVVESPTVVAESPTVKATLPKLLRRSLIKLIPWLPSLDLNLMFR